MSTITERIEEATTNALIDMKVPSKIFLGKKEWAQYNAETAPRIVLAGGPHEVASWFIHNGSVEIIPTANESEFRLKCEPELTIKRDQ